MICFMLVQAVERVIKVYTAPTLTRRGETLLDVSSSFNHLVFCADVHRSQWMDPAELGDLLI